jgi:hypothetical protein
MGDTFNFHVDVGPSKVRDFDQGTGREIAFKKLGPSLPHLFVVLNASDKNGELGKVSHLTPSSLNQSLVFLEDDFGLLVFIHPVDGYAIGISRC